MSKLKMYHILVTSSDDIDPTEHAYFEGDDFLVNDRNIESLEIYDPDTCVLRVFTCISEKGTARLLRY